MHSLSSSQIQARLREQDTLDHLSALYYQLVDQQEEFRAQLEAARALRASIECLCKRVALAGPALQRQACLVAAENSTASLLGVSDDQGAIEKEAATSDKKRPRTSTDALCETALSMVEALRSQSAQQPQPRVLCGIPSTESAPGTPAPQPENTFSLLFASVFDTIIPVYVAELALEEVSFSQHSTDVVAAHVYTRLQTCYLPLEAALSIRADAPPAPALFEEARHHNTEEFTETSEKQFDALMALRDDATTVASALLSLVQPLLTALTSLASNMAYARDPFVTMLSTTPHSAATPDGATRANNNNNHHESKISSTTSEWSAWSPRTSRLDTTSEVLNSPSQRTLTFLAANESTPSWHASQTSPPPDDAEHARDGAMYTEDPVESLAVNRRAATTTETTSPPHRAHRYESHAGLTHTVIYTEHGAEDASLLAAQSLPQPQQPSPREDRRGATPSRQSILFWWSSLFWCRALSQLLLGRVVAGLSVCAAFDHAFQFYQQPQFRHAQERNGQCAAHTDALPCKPAPEKLSREDEEVIAAAHVSCLQTACRHRGCELARDECLRMISCLFPRSVEETRHAADVSVETESLLESLTTPAHAPHFFSLNALNRREEGEGCSTTALSLDSCRDPHLPCALPAVWTAASVAASAHQLVRVLQTLPDREEEGN